MARRSKLLDAIRHIGIIHPGDTLVLSTSHQLTHDQAEMIKHAVQDECPGVRAVVISGLTAAIVPAEAEP